MGFSITIHLATEEQKYLDGALKLIKIAKSLFWDKKNGGYYFTNDDENLLIRSKNASDSAIPSGNSVMLHALIDLYKITKDRKWLNQAQDLLKAFNEVIERNPAGYSYMIDGLLYLQSQESSKIKSLTTDSKVAIKIAENSLIKKDNKINLTIEITIDEGWHINANPASLDFLIPTSIELKTNSKAVNIKKIDYPKAKNIDSDLGKIAIYEKKVLIPVELNIVEKLKEEDKNIELIINAQACKDKSCLLPWEFVIAI